MTSASRVHSVGGEITPDEQPLQVLVVGGGVAGLETVMALRALAGSRVRIKLLTPDAEFVYRAMSVAEPFEAGSAKRQARARGGEWRGRERRIRRSRRRHVAAAALRARADDRA